MTRVQVLLAEDQDRQWESLARRMRASKARVVGEVRAAAGGRSFTRGPLPHCMRMFRLIQEKIRGHEATLDRIHGETGLLEHGEAQQDGIPGFPEAHPAGDRLPIDCSRGVTHVPLGPTAIGEGERNPPDRLNPRPAENVPGITVRVAPVSAGAVISPDRAPVRGFTTTIST